MFDEKRESLHAEGFPFFAFINGGCLHIEGDDIKDAGHVPLQYSNHHLINPRTAKGGPYKSDPFAKRTPQLRIKKDGRTACIYRKNVI